MPSSASVALAAGTAISAMAWAVRGRSSTVFAPSVWRGRPDRKAIALTFDDGPGPATPALLELFARYDIPATFFQIGANVRRRPDLARAVVQAGHEIGNHSQTHPNFALQRPSFIAAEFAQAQETISSATSRAPALLRAPFGVRWFGFRSMQKRLGLQGVMWSLIGLDWKFPAQSVSRRILRRARPGDIICLHDGRGTLKDPDTRSTVEAVRSILPVLLAEGYHFETVTQLLCPMN
jgi:peptidoglycan/xylan/chitin deacetylase (PgdA/CDA1 family)